MPTVTHPIAQDVAPAADGLRILVATDLSPSAGRALTLALQLPWPAGSTIHVLEVIEDPTATRTEELAELHRLTAAAVSAGQAVEREALRARAASGIVDRADRLGADLVIVGSRGRGALTSKLLGSVATEVVDRAHCPVLVVRGASVSRVLLADDGSRYARAAARLIERWPAFRSSDVRVVSVAHPDALWSSGVHASVASAAQAAALTTRERTLRAHQRRAERTALRLRAGGLRSDGILRVGDPAREIVSAAAEHRSDLIVVGTRGVGGLRRLLLGSVAREIVTHAPSSVLVVREPRR